MSFQLDLLPAEKRVLSKIKIELKMLTRNALNANIKRLNDIFKIIKRMESDPELQESIIQTIRDRNSLYKYIMTEYSPDIVLIHKSIYRTVYYFEDYLKYHSMKCLFDIVGSQLKLVDHSYNMFYVNLTDIYDVKYIMYDNLLELVFDRIKKSKMRVLTNEQELKIKLSNGDHELYTKIGKLQEKLSLDNIKIEEKEELNQKLNQLLKKIENYEDKLKDIEITNDVLDNYTIITMIKQYYHQELLMPDLTKVVIVVDGFEWVRSDDWVNDYGRQMLLSPIFNFATHETHLEILGQNRVTEKYQFKLKN
jgi:hypothetical protein